MKIVKSVGDSGLLITGVTETVENETKQQKGRFLVILLGTFGPSFLGICYQVKELTG